MSAEDRVTIDSYAKKITDRGLSVPAIFFLEMFKYLSFIFSQSMIVFGPLATIFMLQDHALSVILHYYLVIMVSIGPDTTY